jgi:peptidoglycan/LPS O-acetylase OafA/YrhL
MVNWLILREWPILFVGWSLEYEALFYLLFALASLTVPLRRVPWLLAGALAVTVWLGWLEDMVLEFAAGMLIARLRIARDHLPGAGAIFALGVVGFVLPVLGTPVAPRALYLGIPSGMIVLGAVFLPQVKSRFGEYLGAASYSIYLGQVFALPAAYRVVQGLVPGAGYDLKVLAMGAIAIALGCLLYSVIELPMTRWLRGRARRPRAAPA